MKNHTKNSGNNCDLHHQPYSHFCLTDTCLSSLCIKCLQFHKDYHRDNGIEDNIEEIDKCLEFAKQFLTKIMISFSDGIKTLEEIKATKEKAWEVTIKEVLEKLVNSKKIVYDMIDTYFKELQTYLIDNVLYPSRQKSLQPVHSNLSNFKRRFTKMEKILDSLKNDCQVNEWLNYIFKKNIGKVIESNEIQVTEILQKEIKNVPNSDKIEIYLESDHVKSVYSSLQNFININANLKELINMDDAETNFTESVNSKENFSEGN